MKKYSVIFCSIIFVSCELFEDPDAKDRSVIYQITGTTYDVNLTINNSSGGTEQLSDVKIPWTRNFSAKKDAFLYLSAQNNRSSGSVTATITVDGKVFKTSTSSGAYVISTASGSCP